MMAAAFVIVIAPNAWWLVTHDFMPFHYVDDRAKEAAHWYQFIIYPLQWTGSQLLFLMPAAALLALPFTHEDFWELKERFKAARFFPASGGADTDETSAFNRRYVTVLALGPFAITTLIFALLGRLPVAMWGYPLWSFAPLAALMWLPAPRKADGLIRFAGGFVLVFLAIPLIYAAVELGEPFLRDRPKATQFPGEVMAEIITREWHDAYGTPLVYAGGTEFAVNNLVVYSSDHPHEVVHGDPKLSPWIDMADLRRRGGVLVWQEGHPGALLDEWRATFGDFAIQPALVLARQTHHPVRPERVIFALIPPQP
jgi:hypothetical protein